VGLFDNFVKGRQSATLTPTEAAVGLMVVAYQSLFTLFPYRPLFEEDYDFFLGYVSKTQFLGGQSYTVLDKPHAVLEGVTNLTEAAKALELFATYIPAATRNNLFAWYCQLVFDEDNICTLPMDDEHRSWSFRTMDMVKSALGVDNALAAKIADVMYLRGKF
jgi:hypothetical protein